MLILKDGPKCYEMFEKISLDTLEHLLNKIKQELQDSEAEVYVTKCKELINEKIRITTLKEYIEKMYKSYVDQNNIVLNHIAINKNLIGINNDLKSWKSTSSLKQKIKEILLKQHEGSFVTKKVEANAIKDIVEIAKPSNALEAQKKSESIEIAKPAVLQATQTDTKDSSVEMVKPTIPQIAETLNKDGSFGIVKPIIESNAKETHKKDGSIEIVTHKNNAVIEVVKQTLPKPTVSKPIVSNATETFQNNEFVQIGKPTLLATIDTHKKNYHVDIVKLNGKSGKKDNANKTLEPTVSNVVDSHKKRDSVDGVKSMFRETKNCDISPTNDLTNSVNDSELPNKNPNKSNAVNLDESGNIAMDLNASVVFLGNEFSEVKDPRIRRQSINIEPDSLNSNVNVQVDESIVYKLIPLDVFIPFVRARNHLASYSKREEEAKDKGELFKPDLRLEKDKLRLKQEIQEELALSETIKEGSSRTEDKIPKDVVKIVDPSVKVVKAGIEKTSNSATKKCNTEDLVIQVKCKDPRLEKRDVGLESNTNPKNVSDQDKSNKKEIALPDNPLSSLPLLCNQIIEASCANVQLNKENHRKEAGNIKEILENKLTINTGLDSKHSKLHSILKTTKRDVLQSDSNNIPCEHNRSRNFLQQKIDEIGTSLKPKASSNLKPKTEQLKPDESNSWNRIPFQCSQNNENLYRKIQYYKIPKISRAIKTPSEKNMSELWIPKAKETNSENSMKPSEPKTEKDNNLKIECDTKVLKTNKEIDSGTDTKNSQPKIETSHTLQVDRKMTDIDNPSNVKKNTENASPAVKEFTPVKDKPKHTDLKKKRNKQTSETTNHVLLEKISKLERDMLDSKNDSEKIDVKNITGNDKLGPNYKVIDLFGDTPKSLKNKRTATENKDGKIKNSGNNGSEEGKGKSKENNEGIVIEKPLNKSKDNPKIMILKTLQSGNESVRQNQATPLNL
uniref:Uncharacterized protein n=1 Tax=Cacopsylla melanoneura TaxID=428564 RepID=A0A8D8WJD5_9HEMI